MGASAVQRGRGDSQLSEQPGRPTGQYDAPAVALRVVERLPPLATLGTPLSRSTDRLSVASVNLLLAAAVVSRGRWTYIRRLPGTGVPLARVLAASPAPPAPH
jgi:hypothetical protein